MDQTVGVDRDDRVLRLTRALAFVIVPILTIAWMILWVFPERSAELFSWPVKPPATATMLGATYLGGAWFFGRVVTARAWHTVTLGFLPVAAFAAILGLATILHWDRFTAGHPSFIIWTTLYFSLPFIIPVVWWRNARRDPGSSVGGGRTIAGPILWMAGGLGVVLTTVSVVLVVTPDVLIPTWPWALTPLTARVMGAMFALTGTVGIGIALDRRPMAARAVVEAEAVAVAGIVVGMIRTQGDVAWGAPGAWLFVGGMIAALAINAAAAYGTHGRASPDAEVGRPQWAKP